MATRRPSAAGPVGLPRLSPMLASPGRLPSAAVDGLYGYEVKWDGARLLVYCSGDGTARPVTRTGRDASGTYPELAALGASLRRPAILDGEVVVLDERGRPDFGALQTRMTVRDGARAGRLARTTPVHLMIFDVLHLDGRSLLTESYTARRGELLGLGLAGARWATPAHTVGHGRRAFELTREQGFEGIVCKLLTSPYRPGVRSDEWIKIKHQVRIDVVIGGWLPVRGRSGGVPGALLVGVAEAGGLRFVGAVGSGMSGAEQRQLAELFAVVPRETSPFAGPVSEGRGARWVEPRLVAEVSATGWTSGGYLRHPVFERLRPGLARPV
ncbi:ATP-dependent DNA ligase [Embleya scabrispora]|uniref:DNA ligase (ATP) n=1 Tax=Embleya scabrispora TaxID=159449 RepID=A0A1T3P519_9ACTN|nr:non-homologous end-joining DNA ligase [Embleya scabrispora]OPC84189.1 ATP-dependent DNA ligase [Embleya scabrispora]